MLLYAASCCWLEAIMLAISVLSPLGRCFIIQQPFMASAAGGKGCTPSTLNLTLHLTLPLNINKSLEGATRWSLQRVARPMVRLQCAVRAFRQKCTLDDAIRSHTCPLQANMRVTDVIPLGWPLLLPVGTVHCVQTLKVEMNYYMMAKANRPDLAGSLTHALTSPAGLRQLRTNGLTYAFNHTNTTWSGGTVLFLCRTA
jgi:hypothetical protein